MSDASGNATPRDLEQHGAVEEVERECPECGQYDRVVEVWEDRTDHEKGASPDYVGCTRCSIMEEWI